MVTFLRILAILAVIYELVVAICLIVVLLVGHHTERSMDYDE